MPNPHLLVITGPPASGKTTLGLKLAHDLHLPFLSKDAIKELLFDTLGWSDREWSKRLGGASMELLYQYMAAQLKVGRSLIAESNFHAERATARLRELQKAYDVQFVQIYCIAEEQTLLERFQRRGASGVRHPGHLDHIVYAELQPALRNATCDVLKIDGALLRVDTTDFAQLDYARLLAAVEAAIATV